tara:strand:- start:1765 stop:2061 length:297 start_codon:yes stop_codon:yes gene_type:complete
MKGYYPDIHEEVTEYHSHRESLPSHYFCVWAYRYGFAESYNFPVGIFTTKDIAKHAAERHRNFRGAKYDHRIYKLPVGVEFDAEEAELVQDFLKDHVA